jgi:hypothetical protein
LQILCAFFFFFFFFCSQLKFISSSSSSNIVTFITTAVTVCFSSSVVCERVNIDLSFYQNISRFARRAAARRLARGLGNPDAIPFPAKNTSFAPGSASGSPAVPPGTLAPATPASASGGYSPAAPGSVLARLQAKWRQETEDKRQKTNKEAKEKKEEAKAEETERAHELAKKEKKDEKKKKKKAAKKEVKKQQEKAEVEQKRVEKKAGRVRELTEKKEKKEDNTTAEKKKAAQKRKIKRFKSKEMRLRRKTKKQYRRAAAFSSIAFFHRYDGKISLPWMPSFSEFVSFASAVPSLVPGLPGGSDDYVPSDVDMLPDCFSSFFFPTFIIRARAALCGGIGRSKVRRSSFLVPEQVRSGLSPRASKRTDPKDDRRAMPYLGCIRNALNGHSINQYFDAFGNNRC